MILSLKKECVMKKLIFVCLLVLSMSHFTTVYAKTEISIFDFGRGGARGDWEAFEEMQATIASNSEGSEAAGGEPVQSAPSIKIINVHIQMPYTELNKEMENTMDYMNDYFWIRQ